MGQGDYFGAGKARLGGEGPRYFKGVSGNFFSRFNYRKSGGYGAGEGGTVRLSTVFGGVGVRGGQTVKQLDSCTVKAPALPEAGPGQGAGDWRRTDKKAGHDCPASRMDQKREYLGLARHPEERGDEGSCLRPGCFSRRKRDSSPMQNHRDCALPPVAQNDNVA
jgi:hypothetical protein